MYVEMIEKNALRATFTQSELSSRRITLNDLYYGSPKMRSLISEAVGFARKSLRFETPDMPLIAEAVPMSDFSLELYLTWTQDPEAFDSRFSEFTVDDSDVPDLSDELADYILNLLKNLEEYVATQGSSDENTGMTRLFATKNLARISALAIAVAPIFYGNSSVYLDTARNTYYILLYSGGSTAEDFNKICNIACEYVDSQIYTPSEESFIKEHFKPVRVDDALSFFEEMSGVQQN
ncbi:MAG: adaptor protein MecA [Lachnospiraceae bacterium]|nr:adaptor protein MecA [Lachnospiraceae bacterium]MCR4946791.1 adaptor protein MecA [Lachnospiraceae bacterium]